MGITTHRTTWVMVGLLTLCVLAAAYIHGLEPAPMAPNAIQPDAGLSGVLNACEAITEKAALALPPAVVEFQRLEQAGRKAHVFRLCMRDRGYQESPRWTEYAQPLAQRVAHQSQISVDEAMENLRRADMQRIEADAAAPAYWSMTH